MSERLCTERVMRKHQMVPAAMYLAAGLSLLTPLIVDACTIVYPQVRTGGSFRVRVLDHANPVQALRLVLHPSAFDPQSHGKGPNSYSLTDSDGYAQFKGLNPGQYLLYPDHDAGVAHGATIEVDPNGATNLTLTLKWPSAEPFRLRSLNGILRGTGYYPSQKQMPISLGLREEPSNRVLAVAQTDTKGQFKFSDNIKPGLYFLDINNSDPVGSIGEKNGSMVLIEIATNANEDGLDLDFAWSSCGLAYAQRRESSLIEAQNVCGVVTDASGEVVRNGMIWLLSNDENPRILEEAVSDRTGNFILQYQNNGTYQLLVRVLGFRPFLRTVRIEAAGHTDKCRQPINVNLEVMF